MKQSFYKIKSNHYLHPLRRLGGLLLWLLPLWLSAQTSTQNYIVTTAPYQSTTDPTTLTDANSNTTIQYFDGLGRPSQTVQRAITPSAADLVSGIEYDTFGRDYRHWLPGKIAGNNGAFVTDFGTPATSTNGGDASPYATTEYDGSPLNRVTGQYGAGADWYNNTKKKTISYTTNGSDVKYFYVEGTQLKCNSTYTSATLYGQKTTDEDGKTVEEFTDKQGRKVLSRVAGDHDTYYVYDDLDNLRYVLPPMAADAINSNNDCGEGTGTPLDQYGYIYRYDDRNNCTYKKLPGCEPIYMGYDKANRLIISQDGNQRLINQWTITKYDVLGRMIYTAEGLFMMTYEQCRDALKDMVVTEDFTLENPTYPVFDTGYSKNYYHLRCTKLYTVNYYNDYQFLDKLSTATKTALTYDSNQEQNGYTAQYSSAKGLLTGTRIYHLDDPTKYETTALYYDKYGRVVQSRATNHLGGYDISYNAIDFTGKPSKTYKSHGINGITPSITELYTYTYDKAQRPTTTTYSLNGGSSVTLASNTYDELGRLASKKRHTNADTETYGYNVRSWPTSISSGGFTENLYYNANPLNSNATYNGNISYSTWIYNGATKGYLYDYDGLNRLTAANFKQGSSSQSSDSFNESFTFDKMGNILTLQRKKDNVLIDDLTLHYKNGEKSNQLEWITDAQGTQALSNTKEYQDISKATSAEFAYDTNGNMTKDLDRNIVAIQYNVLNLPDIIQFRNGNQIKNSYNADGHKLGTEYFTQLTNITPLADGQIISQSYNPGTVDQTGNAYIGTMEYKTQNGNSSLTTISRIYNDEGYVETPSNPQYYYYRKDHLGDNREVWLANTGETVQRTQYYPSGLPWASNTGDNPDKQQRKYNGKEFVEMHGYDTYDIVWRQYYPAIMRFQTPDPEVENDYDLSPYSMCGDNMVLHTDPDGRVFGVDNLFGAVIGAGVEIGSQVITNAITGKHENISWGKVGLAAAEGFLTDGASNLGKAAIKVGVAVGNSLIDNHDKGIKAIATDAAINLGVSKLAGGASKMAKELESKTLNKVGDKLVPSKTQIVNQLTGKSMSRKEATVMAKTIQKRITNVATHIKELPKEAVKTVTTGAATAGVDEQKKKQNHQ